MNMKKAISCRRYLFMIPWMWTRTGRRGRIHKLGNRQVTLFICSNSVACEWGASWKAPLDVKQRTKEGCPYSGCPEGILRAQQGLDTRLVPFTIRKINRMESDGERGFEEIFDEKNSDRRTAGMNDIGNNRLALADSNQIR